MFKKFVVNAENSSDVEEFKAKEFSLRVTPEAESFERAQLIGGSHFVIDKNSSDKSGLSYLKDKRIEGEIKKKVDLQLTKEKESIFENYKEQGFAQGLVEGKEEGKNAVLSEFKESVEQSLFILNSAVEEVQSFKKNLISNNEDDIIKLVQLAVEKICMREVEIDLDFTKKLIEKTIEENSEEEVLEFSISTKDHEQLTDFIQQLEKEALPQEISFRIDEKMSMGGLILKSSNGKIDRSLETRFKNVWNALQKGHE